MLQNIARQPERCGLSEWWT